MSVQLDKDQMDQLLVRVQDAQRLVSKMTHEKAPKKKGNEDIRISFSEFAVVMQLLCMNDTPDLRKVSQAMLAGQPHLSKWLDDRRPCENEMQSRWDLKMITRHEHAYQVLISEGKYKP